MSGTRIQKWFTFLIIALIMGLSVFSAMPSTVVHAQADDGVEVEIVGPIQSFDATSITVNGLVADTSTARISVQLIVGTIVEVEATLYGDGSLVAREIDEAAEGTTVGELELTGVLESIEGTTYTIAGLQFNVTLAEIDSLMEIGDTVKVHFMIAEDGTWLAREISRDNDDDDDDSEDDGQDDTNNDQNDDDDNDDEFEFEIIGTLDVINENSITVGGIVFDISDAKIEGVLILGVSVKVEGSVVDGQFVAQKVELKSKSDDDDDDDDDSDDIVLPGDCSQPAGWTTYAVQSGDTLTRIATATQSSVSLLVAANCIENPRAIAIGTLLWVPQAPDFSLIGQDDDDDDDDGDGDDDDDDDDDDGDDDDGDDDDGDDDDGDDDDGDDD